MANVFDAAHYILEKSGRMSTMKLQKLCYYAQAWSLVWDDAPLFPEDFQAWANGPVCPELFKKTQGNFSVIAEDETGGEGNLTSAQIETIDAVLDYYGDHDAQWLSRLSQEDMWQIRISASKGGIHGIFFENIFFVIWFDPHHNLYPNEKYGGVKKVIPPLTCCKDRDIKILELQEKYKEASVKAEFWGKYAEELERRKN